MLIPLAFLAASALPSTHADTVPARPLRRPAAVATADPASYNGRPVPPARPVTRDDGAGHPMTTDADHAALPPAPTDPAGLAAYHAQLAASACAQNPLWCNVGDDGRYLTLP